TGVRAAVMTRPRHIEVEAFTRPEPEAGAVLIEVVYSGVCGTDKHTFRGETIQYAGTPHERRLEYPVICGHENVGGVVETGGEVYASDGSPLRPGERIVPGANVACGRCWFCRAGFPYYACEQLEDYGNSLNAKRPPHLFGGWSELMYLLPGTRIFRVPDELPSEVAVLTEVMAVTHGLDAAARLPLPHTFRPDSSVAVIRVGPLGLCHTLQARLRVADRDRPAAVAPQFCGTFRGNVGARRGTDGSPRSSRSDSRPHGRQRCRSRRRLLRRSGDLRGGAPVGALGWHGHRGGGV